MKTATKENATTPVPGTGQAGQTFLVGESIYLRSVEEEDAKYGMSWYNTVFPKSTSRIEKWINEEMKEERDSRVYLVVRRSDDRPIGSVKVERWAHARWVIPYSDRLYGEQGDRWIGEALQLVLPWLIDEQHRVIAFVNDVPADKPIIREALEQVGARRMGRFREAIRRGATFIDSYSYDYPNRKWIETLGDPADIPMERGGTGDPRPVSPPVRVEGALPKNAMRVGERVYLRPLQKADAKHIVQWARQETEPFWCNGRSVYTVTTVQKWFERLQGQEPQDWVRFAVCLRKNDELIGAVGIDGIDYQNRCAESESEIGQPAFRGGGYGSEAKHLLFDYAFNTLGLHSLQSWVFYPNTRSAAALRKQGYREAGRESWRLTVDGGYQNFATFDLLAEEWRAMPRRQVSIP